MALKTIYKQSTELNYSVLMHDTDEIDNTGTGERWECYLTAPSARPHGLNLKFKVTQKKIIISGKV